MRFRTLLLSAAVLAACASDADAPPTDPADDTEAVATGDQLFDTAFASVCRGSAGQPGAAAYQGDGPHPFLVMTSDDGTDFSGTSAGTFPDGWRVSWPDLSDAQLVLCQTRVSATPAELCEGYEDDDTGTTWTVQTYDAVYEVDVREAQSGEILGSEKFEVPTERCPMFSMFSQGDPDPKPSYPRPSDGQLEVFMRPFVTGS